MERRKVPGRKWVISLWIVDFLVKMGISANGASVIGMVLGILSGVAFYLTKFGSAFYVLGAVLIFFRSAFNIFDGMIAHRTGNLTKVGNFLNDFTDRVADVFMIVGYGYAVGSSPILGFTACIGALMTATARLSGKVAGGRMHYGGIMSKPVRMYTLILSIPLILAFPGLPIAKYTLAVVAVGSFITVLQRTWWILRELY